VRAVYDTPASLRMDIPKDDVPVENRTVEGVKYFDTGTSEQLSMEPIYKIVEETLQQAAKKRSREGVRTYNMKSTLGV